jgi:hypothetical protein
LILFEPFSIEIFFACQSGKKDALTSEEMINATQQKIPPLFSLTCLKIFAFSITKSDSKNNLKRSKLGFSLSDLILENQKPISQKRALETIGRERLEMIEVKSFAFCIFKNTRMKW